ncbi:adenine-specific DNA-methyltransferase [Candidatus Mycoplasma haematolamae str. Purdue]|uniref:site-specific DNA-methyltransferase (adenine-specific) n=1 Tax=Mycoplasma haematolamae (strain Purdue) TaxID=1212765 RepID=I7BA46_MYCHA|nr:class I SAM-dependent DNA methyltransferase [Candidatus Mycoplasma haematolamae]AFO52160.1 adenine-specific DNA-methyltransferase [Candidatus Mycoplasma haematolamae str. Purdue]
MVQQKDEALTSASPIVQKVLGLCKCLSDDGISSIDFLEQITLLIFLKIMHEFQGPPHFKTFSLPDTCGWNHLVHIKGEALKERYRDMLQTLREFKKDDRNNMITHIFANAYNKIMNPSTLARLIEAIDSERWTSLGSDVKGDIYEVILHQHSQEGKQGAGQYFTPLPLIKAIVKCMDPAPKQTIADPCCGSGRFLLLAKRYIEDKYSLNTEEAEFLRDGQFFGGEIAEITFKLCLMNLYLNGIGDVEGRMPVERCDSLLSDPGYRVDFVLTNPPFGKSKTAVSQAQDGSQQVIETVYNRADFWLKTKSKQLNFLQHINTILKTNGQAAVVIPDNVLFEGGGSVTLREKLLETTDLHTILRLPKGIFLGAGVNSSVIFFDKKPASPDTQTKEIWFYDLRSNNHLSKGKTLRDEDLKEFVECYKPNRRHERQETYNKETNSNGRWRKFSIEEIKMRDKLSLDLFWIQHEDFLPLHLLPSSDSLLNQILDQLRKSAEGIEAFKAQYNPQT